MDEASLKLIAEMKRRKPSAHSEPASQMELDKYWFCSLALLHTLHMKKEQRTIAF